MRQRRVVQFVHAKGYSDDGGNDRADELVQWGESRGTFSRLDAAGSGEGGGRMNKLVGHVRKEVHDKKVARVLVLGEAEPVDGEDTKVAVLEPTEQSRYEWHDLESTSQIDLDELAKLLRFSSDIDDGV